MRPLQEIPGATHRDIRRLARCGGVKRISGILYDEIEELLKRYLEKTVGEAKTFMEGEKRGVIFVQDVLNALRKASGEEWSRKERERKEKEENENK